MWAGGEECEGTGGQGDGCDENEVWGDEVKEGEEVGVDGAVEMVRCGYEGVEEVTCTYSIRFILLGRLHNPWPGDQLMYLLLLVGHILSSSVDMLKNDRLHSEKKDILTLRMR